MKSVRLSMAGSELQRVLNTVNYRLGGSVLSEVHFSFNSTMITSVFVSPMFSPMCVCPFTQATLPALTSTSSSDHREMSGAA